MLGLFTIFVCHISCVLKFPTIYDLNARVSSFISERDEANRKLGVIGKEYDDLKSSAAKKAISDAQILEDRNNKLRHLKEQLVLALDEELILAHEALKKSQNGAFDHAKQLEQSRNLCS
ncbi:hypothetical protein POM88_007218 [Heracleum sosnowskyi]|uniref:Uncharacterized protein n=1 Tax=Heracleum sosnowskyi TaxID=360622 RepID=A0AAD8J405_9APIA|nr:hypothetical protein POM88_007218 [Heracleum sosnowskyi]